MLINIIIHYPTITLNRKITKKKTKKMGNELEKAHLYNMSRRMYTINCKRKQTKLSIYVALKLKLKTLI